MSSVKLSQKSQNSKEATFTVGNAVKGISKNPEWF
jgi:hypothetical protein